MTKTSERYEGNFLEGVDLEQGRKFDLVIKQVDDPGTIKDARGKVIDKAVITFEKATKRLIVNKTMWEVICLVHGKDDSQWPGKRITLMRRYLREAFGEKNVPVPRVVPPPGTPMKMSTRGRIGKPEPYTDAELSR